MARWLFATAFAFTAIAFGHVPAAEPGNLPLIPRPMKIQTRAGFFTLTPETAILVSPETRGTGEYLAKLLSRATGFNLEVGLDSRAERRGNCIILRTVSDDNQPRPLGPEGYELKVHKDKVIITASSPQGVFYGCQTLRQLLPPAIESKTLVGSVDWRVPQVEIEDMPRFRWRGFLMDCSRTFQTKAFLKRYIDLAAYLKLNIFHLHLTDDQGWRIEIKKHPELTRTGSKFAEKYDKPGGFYTQDDIREIVQYAADRCITIVPEIEMPGHCLAALAVYPELSCGGGPFEIYPFFKGPPIQENVFCAGNEKVVAFLTDVMSEVLNLFPSPYIHIGGDEIPTTQMEKCPKCQAMIKAKGLKNECELQSYLAGRITEYLRSKGRRVVIWEDLAGGLPPGVITSSFRGTKPGIEAIRSGHDVVMSITSHCYLDYSHKSISARQAYTFEAVPPELSAEEAEHILGGEALMWTHIATDEEAVDRQVFPRLIALAETFWSPKQPRQWGEFKNRLKVHCQRLEKMGVKYYRDPTVWPDEAQAE